MFALSLLLVLKISWHLVCSFQNIFIERIFHKTSTYTCPRISPPPPPMDPGDEYHYYSVQSFCFEDLMKDTP